MKRWLILLLWLIATHLVAQPETALKHGQNWTHYVRIAGHGLSVDGVDEIVRSAAETGVFGIEVDNSLTGYYESFLEPDEKLAAIRAVAGKAHAAGNKVFIYTEGLETITANADQKEHTFFKDHPDWVQRDKMGRPAVFGGNDAFWISEGDEDVWISPYAMEWREIFMERIRQIAATGIDGVFVDIPYWMTHFDGWEDTWASFDNYTLAAFKAVSGLNARTDVRPGDFNDPNFLRWVDFRISSLTEFMREVAENGRSVNPDFITIAEIYPGIEDAAVRVGADVYEMYEVVDVVAHEYSAGGYKSADREPIDWFAFMTGMYSFRSFSGGKASWMLTYSWEDHKNIRPAEAMENLMMSQLMAGTNCWDAATHVMSRSNDYDSRKRIFNWIGQHEETFYQPRKPIRPVGIYFSPKTRNYFVDEYISAYRGTMYLMLQGHVEFQIITPRTLADFKGEVLLFPDTRCVSNEEMEQIEAHLRSGRRLCLMGEFGKYDENGQLRESDLRTRLTAINNDYVAVDASIPGTSYYQQLKKEYNTAAWAGKAGKAGFPQMQDAFMSLLLNDLGYKPAVTVEASPFVSTQIAAVDGKPHVFIANFKGLKAKENARQLPEKNLKIRFMNTSASTVYALDYLGEVKKIKAKEQDGGLVVTLPEINRGMVVWCE